MPVVLLNKKPVVPDPEDAAPDGLLAVGGDLSRERLLRAYSLGIFPWYSEDSPILWWSPDPRLVLRPGDLHISRSLARVIKKNIFTFTVNAAFDEVIRACAENPRKGQSGTWITSEMIEAYSDLHRAGFALSGECWRDGMLAGGIYGVLLGRIFFGESMFSRENNASKVALVRLCGFLAKRGVELIDCQVETSHLRSLGARTMPRRAFLRELRRGLRSSQSGAPVSRNRKNNSAGN